MFTPIAPPRRFLLPAFCAACGLLLLSYGLSAAEEKGATTADKLPLVFEEKFENGTESWDLTDKDAWKIVDSRNGKAFSLHGKSKFKPPHRSPLHIALYKDVSVGDLVLEADVLSKGRNVAHRDVCLFFGYQDPAHFYYVHLARTPDDHANQIFIVNGADRSKISTKTSEGTPWNDEWHHVKIVRNVKTGEISTYFDDMQTPAMTATDTTFTSGRVGIGSFDDQSDWDDVKLHGVKVDSPAPKK